MSLFDLNQQGTVSVHGNLDRDTLTGNWWQQLSPAQQSMLNDQGRCTFDLSDVERVDSAGLAWLINAVRDARQRSLEIRISEPPAKLLKLAKISDVDTLLPLN
ncbi:STAS domain-containing protein [Alteromonas halophila]|uniref:Anti-sigma B factor antagonist n=1 Tax=Alteromonas halophila TaxID=516698 RepID=A0A918MWG3_9ALTE|nr:STAS domain-containing protein [Alteromonas halophila]GGW80998.1 anti-sigma B factor antagonist [Alteromonas halophila]